MANTLQIKHSTSTGNAPLSLADGELAINQADALLFWKDDGGTIQSTPLDAIAGAAGPNLSVQYNDSGGFAGSSRVSIQTQGFENVLGDSGSGLTISTPPTNSITLVARRRGEMVYSTFEENDALETPLASHPGFKRVGVMIADPGTTTLHLQGHSAAVTGTASSPTVAPGDLLSQTIRVQYTTAGAINDSAGVMSTPYLYRGNTALGGGFHVVLTFGFSNIDATSRMFVGLKASAPSNTTNPSTWTDAIGIARDEGNTDTSFLWRNSSGTVVMGSLSHTITSTAIYKMILSAKPGFPDMEVAFLEYETGGWSEIYSATIGSTFPTASTFLAPTFMINTGSTSTTPVTLDFINAYTRTDF
jgi:hypothetical protein